jgi:hypothetical protein
MDGDLIVFYLWKHLFIWYRLCFSASGMLSAMLSVLLKLSLDAMITWECSLASEEEEKLECYCYGAGRGMLAGC